MTEPTTPLTDEDYRSLADFRHALRRFLAFSDHAARDHDITPAQHQLLLAIRGAARDRAPSTSDLAEALQLRLHSVGELIDRAEDNGLVERQVDPDDGRRMLLTLTEHGRSLLQSLSVLHRSELRTFRTELAAILEHLEE